MSDETQYWGDVMTLELSCAVCQKKTASFKDHDGRILFSSLLMGDWLVEMDFSEHLKEAIANKDLQKIHAELKEVICDELAKDHKSFISRSHKIDGLDSFCPECNLCYCKEHYTARLKVSSEGSGQEGVCPKGHKRWLYTVSRY